MDEHDLDTVIGAHRLAAQRALDMERERDAALAELAEAREQRDHAALAYELTTNVLKERFGLTCLAMQAAGWAGDEYDRTKAQLSAANDQVQSLRRALEEAERRAGIWMSMIHALPAEKNRMFEEAAERFDQQHPRALASAPAGTSGVRSDSEVKVGDVVVPAFDPGKHARIEAYVWWSWHPRYPYWSRSCWKGATEAEARKVIDEPFAVGMAPYFNKLVRENINGSYVVIEDRPPTETSRWIDAAMSQRTGE